MDLSLSNWQKNGKTICLVIHNLDKAKIFGNKFFKLVDGRIIQS